MVSQPLTQKNRRIVRLVLAERLGKDKTAILLQEINALEAEIKRIKDKLELDFSQIQLKKGDKGDKGDRGERGETGRAGKDGRNGRNGKDGKDGISIRGEAGADGKDGKDGVDGKDGKDGKDGSPDMAEDIRNKLELLEGDERLEIKAIKDLRDELDKIGKRAGRVIGTANFGSFVVVETPTGTVNGSNTVFTLTQAPKNGGLIITQNGQFMRSGTDYTADGNKITMTTAPRTGSEMWAWIVI